MEGIEEHPLSSETDLQSRAVQQNATNEPMNIDLTSLTNSEKDQQTFNPLQQQSNLAQHNATASSLEMETLSFDEV